MIEAVASAMPSRKPTVVTLAPSTVTRNTGSSAWIISDETSMKRLTNPSAHTPRGIDGLSSGAVDVAGDMPQVCIVADAAARVTATRAGETRVTEQVVFYTNPSRAGASCT